MKSEENSKKQQSVEYNIQDDYMNVNEYTPFLQNKIE